MQLHILRHAKAEPIAPGQDDFDRDLASKGLLQAENIGKQLSQFLPVDLPVFCSTSNRTMQTAELIQREISFEYVFCRNELYLATREQLLEFIWSIEGNSDILIIGHNDGISSLASYFANEFISLSTAEFVTIDFEVETWGETSEGNGSILRMCQPNL